MTHSLRSVLYAFASGAAMLALVSCNQGNQAGNEEAPGAPSGMETPGSSMTADNSPMAPATVDKAAEEQAIRDLDAQWVQALNNKDALAAANMYAEDGAIMPPNAPMASGHDAILSTWTQLLATPGLTISFAPTKIVVSDSGDIAIDIGTYTSTVAAAPDPAMAATDSEAAGTPAPAPAQTTETGKYVVTWIKRNGEWKVLSDMFSADAPAGAAVETGSAPMPMSPEGETSGAVPAPGMPGSPTAPIEQFAPGTTGTGDSMGPSEGTESAPHDGSSMAPPPDASAPPASTTP